MIIDIHSHLAFNKIFPEKFLSGVAGTLDAKDEIQRRLVGQLVSNSLSDSNGSQFIRRMDIAGIDKSVLLIADFGFSLGEAALSLEDIFLLHKTVLDAYPDRFLVFGGVDPRRGREGTDLFEKSIRDYKFSGLKLYPPCGFELDHPGLYPLYEVCDQLGLPVLTHTGPSLACMRTEREYPASILKVSAEFKNIRFILGHGGARDCETTIAVAKKRKNVYFDISTFQAYFKEKASLDKQFRRFFDHCPEQVLFGTDWPMFLLSATQRQLRNMIEEIGSINTTEKERVFFKNAIGVLPITI
jgi:uncharacterized protein